MAYIAVKKVAGAYYPVVSVVADRSGEYRIGIPRWQAKKWFLADAEMQEYFSEKGAVKVSIKWDDYKRLEMRVNTIVYNALRLMECSRNDGEIEPLLNFVKVCIEGPKFAVDVDEDTGSAVLVSGYCSGDDSDDPTERFVCDAYDSDEVEMLRVCKFFDAADRIGQCDEDEEDEEDEDSIDIEALERVLNAINSNAEKRAHWHRRTRWQALDDEDIPW